MERPHTFSKQSEFQAFVDATQSIYITEKGWLPEWFLHPWPHILKPEREHLNLPEVLRQTVRDWEKCHNSSFPWHYWRGIRSSRNLHSSQVLGLTLLGAFREAHLQLFERALLSTGLLKPGEVVQKSDFEYEPPNIFNESRRTSVDFMVRVGQPIEVGSPIYIEVKFLEASFGRCSRKSNGICNGLPELTPNQVADQCQLTKEGIRYWEFLPELMDLSVGMQGCPLRGPLYQLARNILHLVQEGGRALILLSDARATYLDDEVRRFTNLLAPVYRNFVYGMKFQQLIPYLSQRDHSVAELLAKKYGIH